MSKWIATSNQGFSPYAMEELRKVFKPITFTQFVPGEIFMFEVDLEADLVLEHIQAQELIFVRHIQSVDREVSLSGQADAAAQVIEILSHIESSLENKQLAIHIRSSKDSLMHMDKAELKKEIVAA